MIDNSFRLPVSQLRLDYFLLAPADAINDCFISRIHGYPLSFKRSRPGIRPLQGIAQQSDSPNTCNAVVTSFKEALHDSKAKGQWIFAFFVQTACARSTGHFDYEYELNAGGTVKVERKSAAGWKAADGNNFLLKEERTLPARTSIGKVSVVNATIKSRKE